jgi:hypothetical protein
VAVLLDPSGCETDSQSRATGECDHSAAHIALEVKRYIKLFTSQAAECATQACQIAGVENTGSPFSPLYRKNSIYVGVAPEQACGRLFRRPRHFCIGVFPFKQPQCRQAIYDIAYRAQPYNQYISQLRQQNLTELRFSDYYTLFSETVNIITGLQCNCPTKHTYFLENF